MTLPPRPTTRPDNRSQSGLDQLTCVGAAIGTAERHSRSRTNRQLAAAAVYLAGAWLVVTGMAGCSGQSNFLNGGTTVGQLKTSLSHMEFENDKLKRSVAKLDDENRILEDKLASEQLNNGDLTARLDDARNLLKDRGLDSDRRVLSRNNSVGGSSDDDMPVSPRTQPASRATRKPRKPPVANISEQVEIRPPIEDDDARESFAPAVRPTADGQANRSGLSTRDRYSMDHHSFDDGPFHWFPVADGTTPGATQVR
jgi:hypothetical protein